MQDDAVAQVLDAVELLGGRAADHAVDLVALLEQEVGEIRAVLAGDAGDEGGLGMARDLPTAAAVTPCRRLDKIRCRVKAVILAGGLGSRLSEETTVKPKPMVEIGGKPILWHIMKIYAAHGIDDFVVCLGYKGYVIKEWFANYALHTPT